jgi:hypothetical protein
MGNTIKRQFLIIAITLSLFVLGSVGVATAGISLATVLDGNLNGKEWCGDAVQMGLGLEVAEKEKIKEDFHLWMDISDFPDIDGFLDFGAVLDLPIDGYIVPKNDKKGVFIIEVFELFGVTPLNQIDLVMNGKYKVNDLGVPTKLDGTFSSVTHIFEPLDPLFNELCVSQKGGKFKAKGIGNLVLIPE